MSVTRHIIAPAIENHEPDFTDFQMIFGNCLPKAPATTAGGPAGPRPEFFNGLLDVTYREDESRIRDVHARENFAWLNRFTLSLLKQHPGKGSLIMKRRSCGWNTNFLLQVLTAIKS